MKTFKGDFCVDGFQSRLDLMVRIRKRMRDVKNGKFVGDPKVGRLSPLEISRDDVTVEVYNGSQVNVIAKCKASLCCVEKQAGQMTTGAHVFSSGREAGIQYAAMNLYNKSKTTHPQYDNATETILIIEELEVAPVYRRLGIATSILDMLFVTLKPNYASAVILPHYIPRVTQGLVGPVQVDVPGVGAFFRGIKFSAYHPQKLNLGGVVAELPMYVSKETP